MQLKHGESANLRNVSEENVTGSEIVTVEAVYKKGPLKCVIINSFITWAYVQGVLSPVYRIQKLKKRLSKGK
jgi:hypothetical protein